MYCRRSDTIYTNIGIALQLFTKCESVLIPFHISSVFETVQCSMYTMPVNFIEQIFRENCCMATTATTTTANRFVCRNGAAVEWESSKRICLRNWKPWNVLLFINIHTSNMNQLQQNLNKWSPANFFSFLSAAFIYSIYLHKFDENALKQERWNCLETQGMRDRNRETETKIRPHFQHLLWIKEC